MVEKVYRLIEQEKLIETGDHVLAGVSGGADSVCMLLLLLEYRRRCRFSLEVIHVEHGIRGEESREDAAFVEALCRTHDVPCKICAVDAPGYAKAHGMGLEEAARVLRYDCYEEAARMLSQDCREEAARVLSQDCNGEAARVLSQDFHEEAACARGGGKTAAHVKVALAHHADDNAETVLFQMVRGSGIHGLCGMRPMRAMGGDASVIRPLLTVTRSEIEEYLRERQQAYRVDATNLDTDYSRNRIRHKVLPELLQINPGAVGHIGRTAGLLTELSDYLTEQTEQLLAQTCHFSDGECEISERFFSDYPAVLQKEAVLRILSRVAGSGRDIAGVHVEDVLRLGGRQVGRRLSLPYRMRAERVYGGVRIRKESAEAEKSMEQKESGATEKSMEQKESGSAEEGKCFDITPEMLLAAERGEELRISLGDAEFLLRVRDFDGEMQEIPKKTYTKWLDYDKIRNGLQLRTRADKDYLTIDGAGHRKKLKQYFMEEKIPAGQRRQVWLLAEQSHVLWVVGGRISAGCRIGDSTKRILEVRMSGGRYREDQED